MKKSEIEELLRQTLSDLTLSRSEKKGLRLVLEDLRLGEGDYGALRKLAFEIACESVEDVNSRRIIEWLEEVMKVLVPRRGKEAKPSEAVFSPGDSCRRKILSLFHAARKSVDICVFTITDNQLTREIIASHSRGLKIRVITDDETSLDPGSDIRRLQEAGIPVLFDDDKQHMHNKFSIFDGKTVCTGSYNWTRKAATHNIENILVTHDPAILQGLHRGVREPLGKLLRFRQPRLRSCGPGCARYCGRIDWYP